MKAAKLSARIVSSAPHLAVDLEVPASTTLAVMGRNGAGKTTLLRMLAGLLRADHESSIALGERVLADDSAFVPPHRRGIALLAQEPGLFPHLTVAQNIAFGPQAQRLGRQEVAARVERWLEATNTTDLADRKPAQLSGGQAQRVAIARALAAEPQLLLLDEPLRALDVDVAAAIRTLLRSVLSTDQLTAVIVTHDIADAVALGDQLIVMDAGSVMQRGAVRDVLRTPRSAFASQLAGVSLVAGRWQGGRLRGDVELDGECLETLADNEPCFATFSPSDVSVFTEPPGAGSPRNLITATLSAIEPSGEHARLTCVKDSTTIAADVTWASVAELDLAIGATVHLSLKRAAVRIYSAR